MGKTVLLFSPTCSFICKLHTGAPQEKAKQKNMCVYGHPTGPIFQPSTLTFFIGNYSTLIFAIFTQNLDNHFVV